MSAAVCNTGAQRTILICPTTLGGRYICYREAEKSDGFIVLYTYRGHTGQLLTRMLSTPTFKQVPKEEKKKCSFVRVLVQNDVINVTNGEFAKKKTKKTMARICFK